jgi:hypothetical protein
MVEKSLNEKENSFHRLKSSHLIFYKHIYKSVSYILNRPRIE